MKTRAQLFFVLSLSTIGMMGCAKYDFGPGAPVAGQDLLDAEPPIDGLDPNTVEIASSKMTMASNKKSYDQTSASSNRTVISFQAKDSRGEVINDLTSAMVKVTENGVEVPGFNFSGNATAFHPTTDIVFMIDVTCSMSPTINSAKSSVINFINHTRSAGFHTRMCLSTFGDYTVKKCTSFYDNDPAKPETASQVAELISEVTRLSAGCGAADPGGRDLDENPLQAVIDGGLAPFASGSQRFGILITDAGFLFAPTNPGDLGARAPLYSNVLSSLQNSNMTMFLATPPKAGYDRPFSGSQSLVAATGGEYFPYADLVAGRISLETILNRVLLRMQTTYAIEYVADDVPGLNADLPLNQRRISVEYKESWYTGSIEIVGTESSAPAGRNVRERKFRVSDKAVKTESVKVSVNGVRITTGFTLVNGEVQFAVAPAAGAKIEIEYENSKLVDSLRTNPIRLNGAEDTNLISVFLNGKKAARGDIKFEKDLSGAWVVTVTDTALSEADTYGIRAKGSLSVRVFRVVPQ